MQRKHKSDFHTHRGTQHITTSQWLCITSWEGGGAQCWYFCLSWVWAILSWLGPCWQLCTMQCNAALYTCTVLRPLLSPLSDWDSDTLGQPPPASSDPHTQTTTQMIETPANFKSSHTERVGAGVNIYISTETHCIRQQPLPAACQISLKSQWSS